MSGVIQFDEFVGSGRGFLARPILPDNTIAYKANIGEITFSLYKMGQETPIVDAEALDVDVVMYDTLQPWKYDDDGYTFWWAVPEDLWVDYNDHYRIVIRFLIEAPGSQMHTHAFLLVYQVDTLDPIGRVSV